MERNVKFILGGILIILILFYGQWLLSNVANPPPGSGALGRILFLIVFLAAIIAGLGLVYESFSK